MAELKKEIAEYDDFLLLDIEEEYSKLPYKTLVLALLYNSYPSFLSSILTQVVLTAQLFSKLPMRFMILSFMLKQMTTYICGQVTITLKPFLLLLFFIYGSYYAFTMFYNLIYSSCFNFPSQIAFHFFWSKSVLTHKHTLDA